MEIALFFFRLWLALALVKTIMGYVQLPLMLRIMAQYMGRRLTSVEIAQLVLLAPLVTFVAIPHYLAKEGWRFFTLYDEEYIHKKFSKLKGL